MANKQTASSSPELARFVSPIAEHSGLSTRAAASSPSPRAPVGPVPESQRA